ncbi:hypothetical protein [Herbaspirillum rhizosphaerae]|uniref:hypothetical protein n=1 Tax=Herbaspirillum rhizosphaerae TaxID=346179 RepID=UPI00067B8D04|nr:hypothetical protein [Herbaspirillum rhizosphaerae]
MQNDVANHTVNLTHHRSDHDDRDGHDGHEHAAHGIHPCRVRVHRTWFFWSFLILPIIVVAGWSQYVSFQGTMPVVALGNVQHAEHWSEWVRYYVWLQLVWLPANMVIFLIWCALGVRIWNCKKTSGLH